MNKIAECGKMGGFSKKIKKKIHFLSASLSSPITLLSWEPKKIRQSCII